MEVNNTLLPTRPEQIEELMQPGPEGPIYMVNLLKFRDRAVYEDGREQELSGREAYNLYAADVMRLLPEYGAELVFAGDVTFLQIGEVEELWDEIAIARYPSRAELLAMSSSAEWQQAAVHRTAGLKGQLNIETTAAPGMHGLALMDR